MDIIIADYFFQRRFASFITISVVISKAIPVIFGFCL